MTRSSRAIHRRRSWHLILLVIILVASCGQRHRYDGEAGRTLPVILASSTASQTNLRASLEIRPYDRPGADGELPHLVATFTGSPREAAVRLDLHYQVLHFPGSEPLSRDQYTELRRAVDQVLRGEGIGLSRTFDDPTGETGDRTVQAAVAIDRLSDLAHPPYEYVIAWGVAAQINEAGRPLNAAVAGAIIFDGMAVYSVVIPK